MPSGGKKREQTTSGNTERRRSWNESWRSWTPGTGSSCSECLYYLRFHSGEIQATSSQEWVVEPASEMLRLWCRSVCTFLSSKTRDIWFFQILLANPQNIVNFCGNLSTQTKRLVVIFLYPVEVPGVSQAGFKFSIFRSLQ